MPYSLHYRVFLEVSVFLLKCSPRHFGFVAHRPKRLDTYALRKGHSVVRNTRVRTNFKTTP